MTAQQYYLTRLMNKIVLIILLTRDYTYWLNILNYNSKYIYLNTYFDRIVDLYPKKNWAIHHEKQARTHTIYVIYK